MDLIWAFLSNAWNNKDEAYDLLHSVGSEALARIGLLVNECNSIVSRTVVLVLRTVKVDEAVISLLLSFECSAKNTTIL